MKIVRILKGRENLGKVFQEMAELIADNELVSMTIAYRKKQITIPGLARRTTIYLSRNHPRMKQVHTFEVRYAIPKTKPLVTVHARRILHHRSERRAK